MAQFEEIDADPRLNAEQKGALKRRGTNLAEAKLAKSTDYRADNLDLFALAPGELKKMQKKNPLEWESYAAVQAQA